MADSAEALLEALYAENDGLYDSKGNTPPADGAAKLSKQQQQQEEPPPEAQPHARCVVAAAAAPAVPPSVVSAGSPISDLEVFKNATILVDKPQGWTSFDVCNALKYAMRPLGIKKVGHAGTLDPAATGLLIVCTGNGTKSIQGFADAAKEYSGTLRLGEGTPSLDAETPVDVREEWEHVTDEALLSAAADLTGNIHQVPPMYSALHHEGKRLYELAREGQQVERPARPVTVSRFDVKRDEQDRQAVHFYVGCSKGTYIRTLAADLGAAVNSAAHLTALRREAIGEHRVDNAWQIHDLLRAIHSKAEEELGPGAVGTFTPYEPRLKRARSSSSEGEGEGGGARRGRGRRRGKGGRDRQQPGRHQEQPETVAGGVGGSAAAEAPGS